MPGRVVKHGQCPRGKQTRLYRTWANMRSRCNNSSLVCWPNYGGRGIMVCERWADFEMFAADVGDHPGKGWTLDRIDNDGDYEPGNVRWATRTTQAHNSRNCRLDAATVTSIRMEAAAGARSSKLAVKYAITHGYVNDLLRGEAWT